MNRRDVLRTSLGGPLLLGAASAGDLKPRQLPDAALYQSDPEKYWQRIRAEQFLLPEWRHFLNNGSLGVTPRPVLHRVVEYMTEAAGLLMDEYPRWGYETLDAHREKMAAFAGCAKDELAFMHNCTEAMSTIAAGLDLAAGDEVLITNQEHPSGWGPWKQRAARTGITVREVPIPLPPKSSAQLADVVTSAIGPRTKVLSISGILTTTGLIMPVRAICDFARSKGVITVIDGAHMHGQIPLKIRDLGCDFFAASPHKWMFAPAGCGLLYARDEIQDRLWASITTGSWDQKKLRAARFMMVGTNNRAIFEGMMAGLKFHEELGGDKIFARTHELARYVRKKAAAVPYLELLTPDDDTLYGALTTVRFQGKDPAPLWAACRKRKIWTMISNPLRISTHIHTRREDVDAFFSTLREVLG
ncbi:MAG: aminotransferase class V-fold PLP-dependent enzyme [Bryobacter sp.]|nr:aminotransferase class V-fold PLP-dependent enzyme [Bryobacter sp.]